MACVCTLCPADRLSQHGPSPQPLAPGSNRQQCECAVLRGYWCWSVLLGLRRHLGLFQGSRNDAKGAALLGAPSTTITSISTAQPRVPTMQARFALTNAPCTHQTPWQSLIQRSFHCVRGGVCSRPQVYSTPLVGVWVKGPSSVLHPLAAAACLRFACSSLLMDRAVNPEDGSFILLLCPEGEAGEGGCKTVEPCSLGLGMSALRKLVMGCAGFRCWHSMQLHNMHAPCRQCASCAS